MDKIAVPVIMYHSVGIPNKNWQWNHLTIPYKVFESQLKWMKEKRFHTISLQQLYNYMNEGTGLPRNSVVLTFDDGYLDNWVFAYPLLKKYALKSTFYVCPEFVDPRNIVRKNLENVWNKEINVNELETLGYLSWKEMEEMENQEIVDIQSHTMSHTWYPISSKIIDFRHPRDSYIWMTWNDNHIKKPYLQIDDKKLISYGKPVYENGRAIGVRRYFPDKDFDNFMIDYVREKGGEDFFRFNDWRKKLFIIAREYKEKNQLNERFESEKEYEKRIYYELQRSKDVIEEKLAKVVQFLSWPGGAVTDKALKEALKIGYLSSPACRDIEHQRKNLRNTYGENPSRINRIGAVLYWNGEEGINSQVKHKNGFIFILSLYEFQKKKIVAPLFNIFLGGISRLYNIWYFIPLG